MYASSEPALLLQSSFAGLARLKDYELTIQQDKSYPKFAEEVENR